MSGLNLTLQAQTCPALTPLPSSAQLLLNFVAQYTSIAGGSAFNGINFGSQTPAPQNRGLPWFKTDSSGNPIGLFAWNGLTWVAIPVITPSGATSSRPSAPVNGQQYYDTTINVLLMWNANNNGWTTVSGSPGDIKEVLTTDLPTALTNNPGWAQEPSTIGCVIGGAGSATGISAAHSAGSIIGEEAHTLSVSELASHNHAEIYGTYNGQHQNGTQPSGVYPAVTPGSTSIPVASTANSGGGAPHNNIQPTAYLFRLYKVY